MKNVDSFFDTYEKRKHVICLIYFLCAILFTLFHLFMGIHLVQIVSYNDVLNLSVQPFLERAFFGRTALLLFNLPSFDFLAFFTSLSFSLYEVIYFLGNVLGLFSIQKKDFLFNLLGILLIFFGILICFLMAFNSGTLNGVVFYIRVIGWMLIVIDGSLFMINVICFIKELMGYKEALKVCVEIIES